jgi:hypothetical protein
MLKLYPLLPEWTRRFLLHYAAQRAYGSGRRSSLRAAFHWTFPQLDRILRSWLLATGLILLIPSMGA